MRVLTADHKQQCINICDELRQIASDDAAFLSRVITSDENWIYGYDPEAKRNNPPNGKVQTHQQQSQEHTHHFL
jgi:hypothetical protein